MTTMIALVGEQPLPNYIPVRAMQPETVLFVYTDKTAGVYERLAAVLVSQGVKVEGLQTDAYDMPKVTSDVSDWIKGRGVEGSDLVVNFTGGTKPMSLAVYRVAEKFQASLVYLESERKQSRFHRYVWGNGDLTSSSSSSTLIANSITIAEFIRLHSKGAYTSGGYSKDPAGAAFEKCIHNVLSRHFDEVLSSVKLAGALEIDFIIRSGNRFGVVEAKAGTADKKAIDQLHTAASREYFGTYTQRFLVQGGRWDHTKSNLRELAELRGITVIEVPSWSGVGISDGDAENLVKCVKDSLE